MQDHTLDWNAVVKWASSEIDKAVTGLCPLDLTQDHATLLRGEIRALKRLLDLPKRQLAEVQRTAAFGTRGQ